MKNNSPGMKTVDKCDSSAIYIELDVIMFIENPKINK